MRKLNLFAASVCAFSLALGLVSCSENDNLTNQGSKVELPAKHRAYFLNEGNMNDNNANIKLYAPTNSELSTDDIFYKQNNQRLGDTAVDLIKYRGCMYVSVNKSNYIAKLSAAAVEEARVTFTDVPELQGGVRYMVADDGYIYATFYGGAVAKINANNLKIEATLTGLGDNLEGIVEDNGKLYVANSCNSDWVYFRDIRVIDTRTFTLENTIEVAQNPRYLLEEDDKVFVISCDYTSAGGYVLQQINTRKNNEVKQIGYASQMAEKDGILYVINSVTDWSTKKATNTLYTYNIETGVVNNASFLRDMPEALKTAGIYMLEINDNNGDIYISKSDFVTNGTIYRFDRNGNFVESFDAGGLNPCCGVFFD
ncbi:YncE family protein [uncultured Muribaculum sp.]|uniref:YncE family protein n=2 Tax=uncultured Muribaculum sp. TaxID=1918613 RepID=UPI002730A26B|nr:hypothetical protein [uncultured Muribaculum sp.]